MPLLPICVLSLWLPVTRITNLCFVCIIKEEDQPQRCWEGHMQCPLLESRAELSIQTAPLWEPLRGLVPTKTLSPCPAALSDPQTVLCVEGVWIIRFL